MAQGLLAPSEGEHAGQIDLHSGGEDNIFPHHECEIAQSRAASGSERFARHWLHTRHPVAEGETMSKSKGNFITVSDAVNTWGADATRFTCADAGDGGEAPHEHCQCQREPTS